MWIFFLVLLIKCVSGVKILELNVPDTVESGVESIELICNYEYDEEEKNQLDVKWYFNGELAPFIQWIASGKSGPQIIGNGTLSSHVDLSHIYNYFDSFKRHQALLLKNISQELSGLYTCKVSSFLSEDLAQKKMVIYSPASSILFLQHRLQNDHQVNLSCEAKDIYPQPQILLTKGPYQLDDSEAFLSRSTIGNYNILVHRVVNHSELERETLFGCLLTIPGLDYKVREESTYWHSEGRYSYPEYRISNGSPSYFLHQISTLHQISILLFLLLWN